MPSTSTQIILSAKQRVALEKYARSRLAPQRLVERCRIVLLSADGVENAEQGRRLGIDRQRVRRWRVRWSSAVARLTEAEEKGASAEEFSDLLVEVLSDDPRSGTPPTFTPEQVASIIAVACEPPNESGVPVSHWTPLDLAVEVMKRGIVTSISVRQVRRFLARSTCGHT
jgi:putative transposase